MKNFLLPVLAVIFFSCADNTNNNTTADSANAINDHQVQDTTVAPFPDGYAPPNSEIDTSQNKKDSINALPH